MSPTHVDDSSLSLLYHKYLRYVDISKVLYIVRLICILFMIETILIPFYTFEYNRIDMHNLQYFRLYSKLLLESLIVSSIIESMKVRY